MSRKSRVKRLESLRLRAEAQDPWGLDRLSLEEQKVLLAALKELQAEGETSYRGGLDGVGERRSE